MAASGTSSSSLPRSLDAAAAVAACGLLFTGLELFVFGVGLPLNIVNIVINHALKMI